MYPPAAMWVILIAAILGLVEGVTEFIPVSSTGHLIVAGHLLGFTGQKAETFEIFIQMGAILAIVTLEWRRFLGLVRPVAGAPGFSGLRGLALLGLTTAPALVAGLLLHRVIKEKFFGPATVAIALLVGGVGILVVERLRPAPRTESLDDIGWRQALQIGLFQCLALWPGMSRSAATIAGGLLCGLGRRTAAAYSFFSAVPVMAAAVGYDLLKSRHLLGGADILPFGVGFLVAFLAAWATVRLFVSLLGRSTLRPFAWYRIAVAPVVLFLVR
jgi:undecaprenyl-diphosphatase